MTRSVSKQTDAGKSEASNLLAGTLKTAQEVLKAQQTIKANRDSGEGQTDDSAAAGEGAAPLPTSAESDSNRKTK